MEQIRLGPTKLAFLGTKTSDSSEAAAELTSFYNIVMVHHSLTPVYHRSKITYVYMYVTCTKVNVNLFQCIATRTVLKLAK